MRKKKCFNEAAAIAAEILIPCLAQSGKAFRFNEAAAIAAEIPCIIASTLQSRLSLQ